MAVIWEIGNTLTYTGMVVAIVAIALSWLPALVAFSLPLPGMILRTVGTPPYQNSGN